jgi:amino acid adenylation domain-containing protein
MRDVLAGFRAAAQSHPDRAAVVHNGTVVSYEELAGRVDEVARRLGPGPGVVGVLASHTPATVAALLGVWAAGGAYCPVDPAFPAPRRESMLAAAGCRILLDPDVRAGQPAAPADGAPPTRPDDLAYTLFTSGSTGSPRPVLTPHRAIGAAVASLRALFDLNPADRVLQFASLNWDTCFEEILPTLTTGAALIQHDDAHSGLFPRVLRMIERERVSVLDLPTAFWHELVGHLRDEGAPLPAGVRLVVIGGEVASPARLADWRALGTGHARLLNTYGCTETTLVTHAIDLHGPAATATSGGATSADSRVPIGTALPHVIEQISGAGELLIGGPALAAGYRGMPAAQSARFVTVAGRRFFRTGDRVSRRPDGALVHEGRLDDQVKIRGVRVDPAEVEAHIAAHPVVSAVAVTGVGVADHTVLAAYVVARPHADTAGLGERIVAHLRTRVPAHLIPSRISVVADLVYTASGKVDRRRTRELLS